LIAVPVLYDRFVVTALALQGHRRRKIATSVGDLHLLDAPGKGRLPPLVLLHGISSAGAHFYPMLGELRRHVRRLILPDMPGHGLSDVPAAGISGAVLKTALTEALDTVLDEPAVLLGNSMGGIGAIHYASVRPERVSGLILCSPSGAAMNKEELASFLRLFKIQSHAEALSFLDRVLAQPSPIRQIVAWELRRKFANRSIVDLLASLTPEDFLKPEQVRALRPPVLMIWGQADRILPAAHLDFFRQNLPPHARIVTPAGFGHTPFLDDARALTAMVISFLEEIASAQRKARAPARPSRVITGELP
jgi:pimeloyl-ACP methyl ester carboxylesterase